MGSLCSTVLPVVDYKLTITEVSSGGRCSCTDILYATTHLIMQRSTSMSLPVFSPPAISSSSSFGARSDAWTSQTRNPVSLRLYKVLGTKYDDEATKEALKTLSDFYAPTSSSTNTSTSATKGAVDADEWNESESEDEGSDEVPRSGQQRPVPSSQFAFLKDRPPGEVAAKARRNMRRDVEKRLADGSRKFLEAFGDVDQVCVCLHSYNSA
jgi:hypothetical protein